MTQVVFDTSFVIAALIAEDNSRKALTFIAQNSFDGATAPLLLCWEVSNTLAMKHRRGLIDISIRDEAMADFLAIRFTWDNDGPLDRLVELAKTHGLTAYDAAYLELAHRLGAPLVTFDSDLRKAAAAERVTVAP